MINSPNTTSSIPCNDLLSSLRNTDNSVLRSINTLHLTNFITKFEKTLPDAVMKNKSLRAKMVFEAISKEYNNGKLPLNVDCYPCDNPTDDHPYIQYTSYASPDGAYTLLATTLPDGGISPPHRHKNDCGTLVIKGTLVEDKYEPVSRSLTPSLDEVHIKSDTLIREAGDARFSAVNEMNQSHVIKAPKGTMTGLFMYDMPEKDCHGHLNSSVLGVLTNIDNSSESLKKGNVLRVGSDDESLAEAKRIIRTAFPSSYAELSSWQQEDIDKIFDY